LDGLLGVGLLLPDDEEGLLAKYQTMYVIEAAGVDEGTVRCNSDTYTCVMTLRTGRDLRVYECLSDKQDVQRFIGERRSMFGDRVTISTHETEYSKQEILTLRGGAHEQGLLFSRPRDDS